jgi:hypothetical protein
MSKRSKKSHSHEAPAPAVPPARRVATRRAIAERKLRIVERLTSGLSVAHIAHVEQLTIQRVRQIIAEMLEKREVDPPSGYVQLQIARVGEAMVVAHTMMLQGDLQALDRLIKLNGELDRYHGFGRPQLAPADTAAPRLAASAPRALSTPGKRRGKFSSPQNLENARNAEIIVPTGTPERTPAFIRPDDISAAPLTPANPRGAGSTARPRAASGSRVAPWL